MQSWFPADLLVTTVSGFPWVTGCPESIL